MQLIMMIMIILGITLIAVIPVEDDKLPVRANVHLHQEIGWMFSHHQCQIVQSTHPFFCDILLVFPFTICRHHTLLPPFDQL